MPFTFAHPAIIIPFKSIKRNEISMSALAIGSMTPDFEYFLRMQLTGRYSHTVEGMFVMDIPIAIVLYLIFHLLVKSPLIRNCPRYFQLRLQSLIKFQVLPYLQKNPVSFIFCLLIGIASHIIWDGFTHHDGDFVSMYDFLSMKVDGTLPLFRYLQHGSTIVGFLVIGIIFHRMPIGTESKSAINQLFWWVAIVSASILFVIRSLFGFEYYGHVVVSLISSGLVGLVVASLLVRMKIIT